MFSHSMNVKKRKMISFILLAFTFKEVLSASECSETTFTAPSGALGSIGDSNTICDNYHINVSADSKLAQLNWINFEMDATMPDCNDGDHVEVYIGCGSGKKSVSRFCSRNMKITPHAIYSYDGCIDIIHRKKSIKSQSVFSAHYTSYLRNVSLGFYTSTCPSTPVNQYSSSIIITPDWPLTYTKYSGKIQCRWGIDTGDEKKVVKLNFMDLDIYKEGSSCDNKLLIVGKFALSTKFKRRWIYCGTYQTFSLTTDYYDLEVILDIISSGKMSSNRGFIVGITTWTNSGFLEKIFSSKKIVKYVVAPVVVGIVIIFALFYHLCKSIRNRRSSPTVKYTGAQYGTVPKSSPESFEIQSNPNQSYPPQATYYSQQPTTVQQPGFPQQPTQFPVFQEPCNPYPNYQGNPPSEAELKQPLIYPYTAPPPQQYPGLAEPPPPAYPGVLPVASPNYLAP